jgi:2-succinyl-6-hydroxy-2,4-cyclohexadiene-1-carboxylate synthase
MTDPLPYLRWGDPGRPALVLLHGFLGHASDWSEIAPLFAADFDVWALDLPGHGAVFDRPESACSVDAAADAVVATMEAHGVERFALCGYSMGGRIALHLALHHPRPLSQLVLIGASPGLRSRQERADRQAHDRGLAARLDACSSADDVRRFLERWYAAPLWESTPDRLISDWIERRQHGESEGWARSLRAGGTGRMTPLWDLLPDLRVPTLALHGTRDAKFAALADEMADAAPAVRAFAIPNAGHAAHAEQPNTFSDLVIEWLRD